MAMIYFFLLIQVHRFIVSKIFLVDNFFSRAQPLESSVSLIEQSSPKDAYVLIPRTCKSVKLHGKGEVRLQIELSLAISWPRNGEIVPCYSGRPNAITRVSRNGRGMQKGEN